MYGLFQKILYCLQLILHKTTFSKIIMKSKKWHSFQITILVHICYKWNPNYVLGVENGEKKLLTEYHYYISEDNNHDPLFVQHYFALHWAHLTIKNIWPNEHLVWYNGCATQFKSWWTWYHVAQYVYISSYYFQLFLMKYFHSSSCSFDILW